MERHEPGSPDSAFIISSADESPIYCPRKSGHNRATRRDYKLLIERSWADIHHSRIQEWRALLAITAGHVLIWQGVQFIPQTSGPTRSLVAIGLGLTAAFVALVGCFISLRHRKLMRVKLSWIYKAEDYLGLIKRDERKGGIIPTHDDFEGEIPWEGLEPLRRGSTTWYIVLLYGTVVVFDVFAGVGFALGTP